MVSSDPSIKAVIFDYGGVLTTQGRVAINAWTRAERIDPETFSAALKEWLSRKAPAGTPIHRLETGEISGAEFDRLLAARLRTVDGEPVEPDGLMARMFAHMRPDDAMHRLVADLRDAGLRTALLSNSWGNNYPWETLDGLFELSVISSEVGLRKPDPRIYELTLDRLGLRPQEAVFVDDGAPNIEAAEKLGLRGVLHTDAAKTRAELSGLLPRLGPDIAEETE
ncbi:HAD-IA family hydrolase [Saccharopolyspora gloriosae]|uniref:Putative hydrolase of the HAD superfamily n=1 Tax=Saccharopolyspora gloriosae TaxID=455344 RepID=A0A840NGW8_9PSEU|nr:HAD family phosphatase [Saccharopolyspora gloriosae]MBB5070834.1 putative hydrolase of the HAD superfamily [Saccharopolyspora gloriosae]